MKKALLLLLFPTLIFSQQNFQQYVNPFIGTGGHGHTFPGATVPYGMVQLSPDTRIDGSWDGCSGYHYDDSTIYGFSHTHLNGTGVSDFGDIMLMPTMGKPSFDNKVYSSSFSHANEKASAGFYSVKLDKHNIDVRLTSSTRVGFHEYTFNNAGNANIILDLHHRDKLLEGRIRIINNKTIEVLRRSEAWARNQYVYARIEFNVPLKMNKAIASSEDLGNITKVCFLKKVKKGEKILVKVSLSPTSYDGAKLNSSEITHWDFEKVKTEAQELWNKELSKIDTSESELAKQITETNKDKLTIFYTALYHTMIQPNIAEDIDGKYRGRDNQIHVADTFDYYTVFSLWDTFRAAHPLYTLIDKKRTADYINTFIAQYEQGGRLPVWELASNETDCMIGYHSVSVIADAMAKDIKGFDYEKAFQASKASAMRDVLGLAVYKKNGFIAIDDDHESVSKTVEYAYDDWCIAQMALILDHNEDYEYFMKRSQNWKNIFDSETGFMRPKKNGGWDKPFDAREVNNNFTEGNSWQYSFFVPQDISGMIQSYGGWTKFEAKLDEMFNSESKTTGREQVDVTGLIGQYAHGNEPSHHMAYLYNYIGKPEKTKKIVHYILNEFYKNTPDGLIGNEDCGQMSAWYVLSSIGLYQVTPGQEYLNTTEAIFENAKIKLETNSYETIPKGTKYGYFINSELSDWKKTLEVDVTSKEKNFVKQIVPVPTIQAESIVFKDKLKVEIKSQNPNDKIFFIISNENDYMGKKVYIPYTKPFEIFQTSTISAYIINFKNKSSIISATFYKKPNDYTINITSKYTPQYHAGGPEALIDGIFGTENWKKGDWHGYQSQDFEAIIDLQTIKDISTLKASFLQDSRSWILMPTELDFLVSIDNINFTSAGILKIEENPKETDIFTKNYAIDLAQTQKARYVKIIAKNYGKLPEWHQGFGGDAYIFIDEITVK